MKHIKESKDLWSKSRDTYNNYKIVAPMTKLANDIFNAFDYKEDSVMLYIKYGAFKNIRLSFDNEVREMTHEFNYVVHSTAHQEN